METVFIETSIQREDTAPHAYIDCVGVEVSEEYDLEIFFKKSFMEDDSEWSQHKKMIDTK